MNKNRVKQRDVEYITANTDMETYDQKKILTRRPSFLSTTDLFNLEAGTPLMVRSSLTGSRLKLHPALRETTADFWFWCSQSDKL